MSVEATAKLNLRENRQPSTDPVSVEGRLNRFFTQDQISYSFIHRLLNLFLVPAFRDRLEPRNCAPKP